MRLLIDLQGCQNGSRHRGIGRYSLALCKGLLRRAGSHRVVVLLNGLFPDTLDPIREELSGLIEPSQILVMELPGPVDELKTENHWRRHAATLLRESLLSKLRPDAVLVTSMVEGAMDNTVTSVGWLQAPWINAAVLYDLIPLMDPERYIGWAPARSWYMDKMESLRRCDLLLSISASAKREAEQHLGIEPDRVVNISTAADDSFIGVTVPVTARQELCRRLGIQRAYLMHSGNVEPRKNFHGLVQAFAALPPKLRRQYQLVLAGKVTKDGRAELEQLALSSGLEVTDLVLTGYVSDPDLMALYAGCSLFVFPSLHEGFGLPALEAMHFGVPTIGSNTSSIPEVIGLEEATFDPSSTTSMTAAIQRVLTDPSWRAQLQAHADQQASRFSWDRCAQTAWQALERDVNTNDRTLSVSASAHEEQLLQQIAVGGPGATAPSDAELLAVARCMAANERLVVRLRAHAAWSGALSWRIEGPFDSSYSLALVNRECARALEQLGHRVALHSTEGPGDFPANPHYLATTPDIAAMHARIGDLPVSASDVVSRNLYPPRVADMGAAVNLLHPYAWEETGFPQDWVSQFNQHLQGMSCLSDHVRRVLVNNGVRIPMVTAGCGVDHWERIKPATTLLWPGRRFRFLHVSSCFPRKGADAMLKAYASAFTAEDDVSLLIKTFANPHNTVRQQVDALRASNPHFPDVHVIESDLSESELKGLYLHCHVLLAPSRAEGFGLPIAEAMLSGLPVVTTAWGAQTEFCSEDFAWLVDYTFTSTESHFALAASAWADPSVDSLAAAMRQAFLSSSAERSRRAAAGRALLLEHHRWIDVAARAVVAVRDWKSRSAALDPPRTGWITTWNTKCGIASYAQYIVGALQEPVTVLAPRDSGLLAQDGPNVRRCWLTGKGDNDLASLEAAIDAEDLQVLVVQFNYGFFDFVSFGRFLERQVALGRVVIVTMHATADPPELAKGDPTWQLSTLAPALANCARLLVHSLGDLNRLKKQHLIANAALFPHPLWHIRAGGATTGTPRHLVRAKVPVIATFGYCLPHKGLPEVLEALELMSRQGRRCKLLMLNAEYPVPSSAELVRELRRRINGLKDVIEVEFHSEYLSDTIAAEMLGQADLLVFAYQNTQESASGAVRHGLATARPVMVTPAPIFDELGAGVFRAPGQDAASLAMGMAEAIDHVTRDSEQARAVAAAAARWRDAHDVSQLAERLTAMATAMVLEVPSRPRHVFSGSSRWLRTTQGMAQGRLMRLKQADGVLMFGPFISLCAGRHSASIELVLKQTQDATLSLRVVCRGASVTLAESVMLAGELRSGRQWLIIPFELAQPAIDVELQVHSSGCVDLDVFEVCFGAGHIPDKDSAPQSDPAGADMMPLRLTHPVP